jgi:hypothetical protein
MLGADFRRKGEAWRKEMFSNDEIPFNTVKKLRVLVFQCFYFAYT